MHPDDPLSRHFRLGAPQVSALKKLRIATVSDLVRHFPIRFEVSGAESPIEGLTSGSEVTIYGVIDKLETRRSWKRKIPQGEARLSDPSGSIKIMWFHQPYLAKKFVSGAFVKAIGQVGGSPGKLYLANPEVSPADPNETALFAEQKKNDQELFAVYSESRGITSLWFRHAIKKSIDSGVLEHMSDPIPENIRARYHLPELRLALLSIHLPKDIRHAEAAKKRFAFEEIFTIQIARAKERRDNDSTSSFPIQDAATRAKIFLDSITFPPTGAQKRAIQEIVDDFSRGHPMARLLEGDVGSGKTLVAAATAYAVVTSRPPARVSGTLQVAYMAPTEILAEQHFQSFIEYFKDLPINIGLMTGSGCKKFPSKVHRGEATAISRSQLLKWVAGGEIAMLVGTHALIQKSVQFKHLAYAIVDEQHRFGVRQRKALAQKNIERSLAAPHFLSMTATPIPRTLALTLYGDLDVSVLDELPPGRAAIRTVIVKEKNRTDAYEAVRAELKKGRQAYVICPRIEEPDPEKINALQAKSAKAEAKRLQKDVFPEFRVGLLHGALKPAEKDAAMTQFSAHETDVLVATSVVEVGVNVPNATAIMIEGAERFGLAQLHQLRGRVQRSSHPPICFLLTESTNEMSLKRLRQLEKSADGFLLAEADLENRGAGDLYGRQQWGVSDIGMEALKNLKLIQAARDEARGLVARDPSLASCPVLRARAESIRAELHAE